MQSKFKIGIVGIGKIFLKHLNALTKLKEFYDIKCVCENDKDKILKNKNTLSIPIYNSIEEMVDKQTLDLVSLCTPSGIHAEQTIFLSKKNINVVTEKPIATNLENAQSMIASCEQSQVSLFVVKPLRYNRAVNLIKRALSENRFGKIHLVNLNIFWTRPQSYYDEAVWRGTIKLDGGALMNQASHYVDMLNYLFGMPERIQCISKKERDIEVEDTAILNISWGSKILCSMNVTMLTYEKNLEDSITIIGEKGTVKITSVLKSKIDTWKFDSYMDYDSKINNSEIFNPNLGHEIFYKNVSDRMNNSQEKNFIDFKSMESLEIIVNAIKSNKENNSISF